jgi:signal transduction histidine kinase
MEFCVEDTGIGIPEDQQVKVFEKFEQVRRVGMASPEGTGLGLPIAKLLAGLLGGTLTLTLALPSDHGCTFTLSLPLTQDPETTREGDPQPAAAGAPVPAMENRK